MSVRSSAPPRAGMVHTLLIIVGLLAAVLGATLMGIITYNYTSRPELRDPVPMHEKHTALPSTFELA